eukprot:m.61753 g.61753  ORF g.61753 m.61753 type:complete len:86 (+) comp13256_c0_seq3:263-520(+)
MSQIMINRNGEPVLLLPTLTAPDVWVMCACVCGRVCASVFVYVRACLCVLVRFVFVCGVCSVPVPCARLCALAVSSGVRGLQVAT